MSHSTDRQRFAARGKEPRVQRNQAARMYVLVRLEGIKELEISDMRAIYRVEPTGEQVCLRAEEME